MSPIKGNQLGRQRKLMRKLARPWQLASSKLWTNITDNRVTHVRSTVLRLSFHHSYMIICFARLANTGSFVIRVALKAREYLFLFFRYLHKVLGSVRRRWKVGLCGFYSYLCRTVCTMDSTARAGALRLCPRGVHKEDSTSLSG